MSALPLSMHNCNCMISYVVIFDVSSVGGNCSTFFKVMSLSTLQGSKHLVLGAPTQDVSFAHSKAIYLVEDDFMANKVDASKTQPIVALPASAHHTEVALEDQQQLQANSLGSKTKELKDGALHLETMEQSKHDDYTRHQLVNGSQVVHRHEACIAPNQGNHMRPKRKRDSDSMLADGAIVNNCIDSVASHQGVDEFAPAAKQGMRDGSVADLLQDIGEQPEKRASLQPKQDMTVTSNAKKALVKGPKQSSEEDQGQSTSCIGQSCDGVPCKVEPYRAASTIPRVATVIANSLSYRANSSKEAFKYSAKPSAAAFLRGGVLVKEATSLEVLPLPPTLSMDVR